MFNSMSKTSFVTLMTIILLMSCNHTYKKYDKESFPTHSWTSGNGIIFNPQIEDVSKSYKLIFGIRHVYGFQFESIGVTIKTIAPSGKEADKNYDVKVKKSGGDYVGSCAGDLCDLETVLESNIKFDEIGEYKYFVTHNLPVDRIPGVIEVGLIIDESN